MRSRKNSDVPAAPGSEVSAAEGVVVEVPLRRAFLAPIDAALPLRRILIADDNADYCDALRLLLLYRGYEVYTAADGLRGMELALKVQPHLIVTDFNMPRMNGYELVVALRGDHETARIPIVLFTGAANQRQLKGLELGRCRFLEKPFPNELLLAAVEEFVGPGAPFSAPPQPQQRTIQMGSAVATAAAPPAEISLEDGAPAGESEESQLDDASDSPLIARVNHILSEAIGMGASDIHFDPQPTEMTVRFRVDGELRRVAALPASVKQRLATRLKIMSKLVITERRLPQDGQIRARIDGRKIEFRVSTVPGQHGEKIVLRILGAAALKNNVSELGFSARENDCIDRALKASHGLILVTGPTGSGKSTTLYTMLHALNQPNINIMTAEDPIEYELAGITQVAARPAIGLTFEAILRAFMRQDPDVMLVGEIRDLETAEIALKASITGHLVLSTLHTNGAPATVARLAQMGLATYLMSESVRLVIAQRLVRLICADCKAQGAVTPEQARLLQESELAQLGSVWIGKGCSACHNGGYRGRFPIFEVMSVESSRMREAIQGGAHADAVGEIARAEGMVTLREAAVNAVVQGRTSLSEALEFIVAR